MTKRSYFDPLVPAWIKLQSIGCPNSFCVLTLSTQTVESSSPSLTCHGCPGNRQGANKGPLSRLERVSFNGTQQGSIIPNTTHCINRVVQDSNPKIIPCNRHIIKHFPGVAVRVVSLEMVCRYLIRNAHSS